MFTQISIVMFVRASTSCSFTKLLEISSKFWNWLQ